MTRHPFSQPSGGLGVKYKGAIHLFLDLWNIPKSFCAR